MRRLLHATPSSLLTLATAIWVLPGAFPATAHPHSWITTTIAPLFDDAGRFASVRQTWAFDYDYSLVARQLLDDDRDGMVTAPELAAGVAEGGVLAWIPQRSFFTRITAGGREVAIGRPQSIAIGIVEAKLIVVFTLPLVEPLVTAQDTGVDVFDADLTFGVELGHPDIDRAAAPSQCKIDRRWTRTLNDPAEGFPARVQIECRP
jgi:ABC-type uncharacterized transport system substrate-binding protein